MTYPHKISPILLTIMALEPKRVLDVGVGFGKWGFLMKEYLDGFSGQLHMDGVEAHKPSLVSSGASRWYNSMYLHEFNGCMIHQPKPYDLVLMLDILQCFERKDGGRALLKALELGDRVLVSVPLEYTAPPNGNPYNESRSEWTPRDFEVHLKNAWEKEHQLDEDALLVTNHSHDNLSHIMLVRKRKAT